MTMQDEGPRKTDEGWLGKEMIAANIRLDGTEGEYLQSVSALFTECDKRPQTYRSLLKGILILSRQNNSKELQARLDDLGRRVTERGGLPRLVDK